MRTAAAAIVAALLLAAPAQALDGDWRARAGIEKAKAAGIQIDPAVEEAMERAPIGSCPNDPTQPKCPKATRMVRSPSAELPDGSTAFAPLVPTPANRRSAPVALSAQWQWPWQCQHRLSDQSPYKAAGYAQMDASATCSSAVTAVELYGFLRKQYAGHWYTMADDGERRPGGQTARVHPRYGCAKENVSRYWQAHTEGWALISGGWYLSTKERKHWLSCG